MIERKWFKEKLEESRKPVNEILEAMEKEKWDAPDLKRDLQRVKGQLTYWIET